MDRRTGLKLLGAGVAFAYWPTAAHAWTPPAEFLLKKLHKRRRKVRTLTVQGMLKVFEQGLKGESREMPQKLHLSAPTSLRVEVQGPDGLYEEVADGKRKVSLQGGVASTPKVDEPDLWRSLLIGAPSDIVLAAERQKIDLTKGSLARLPGKNGEPRRGPVCYVIGAASGEMEPAQIWINKDTYLPALYKLKGPPDQARIVLFEGWEKEGFKESFPMLTTRRLGIRVTEIFQADQLQKNPKLAPALFDVDAVLAER